MSQSQPEKEIDRIEQELDAPKPPRGKPPSKRQGGDQLEPPKKDRSLDAVLVAAVLLFVVAAALVFAGRLSTAQRQQLTAGSVGGAIGLLIGYGVGRIRP